MNFQTGKHSLSIFTHTHALYKRIGYVIIPKPHFSSREGIDSRCRRFELLLFTDLAQPVAAMTAVVPAGRWRSIDCVATGVSAAPSAACCFIQHKLARESGFAIMFGCFSRINKFIGRTETRTSDRMCFQSIRTV